MRRRTPTWLAAVSLGLTALLGVPSAHAAETPGPAGHGPALYVPDANPAAYRQA